MINMYGSVINEQKGKEGKPEHKIGLDYLLICNTFFPPEAPSSVHHGKISRSVQYSGIPTIDYRTQG